MENKQPQTAPADVRENIMGTMDINPLLIKLSVPMMVSMLVQALYNVVDSIFVSHVSENALTAVSLAFSLQNVMIAVGVGTGVGVNALLSKSLGEKDQARANQTAENGIFLSLCSYAVFLLIGLTCMKPYFYAQTSDMDIARQGILYLSICCVLSLGLFTQTMGEKLLAATGRTHLSMISQLVGAVVNIVLDPIFIFWLDLGVQGAAWATVIAQGCSAVWVLVFLTGRRAALRLRPQCMALKAARVRRIVSLGLSGFFMNLTNSLVQVVCNATLQVYGGDLYVGVMTIINSLREVFMMPVHGLSNGAQPVTGYNYGAGLYSRVRQSIRFSVAGTVGCAALFWAAAMVFPGALIRIFNGDAEVLAAGVPALRIYFCLFIPMSLQMAGQGVFVSLGRSRQAIFFSLLRKAVINAPLTVLLPVWLGTDGVFVAEAVSQLVGGLACIITMYWTVYRPFGRLPDRAEG